MLKCPYLQLLYVGVASILLHHFVSFLDLLTPISSTSVILHCQSKSLLITKSLEDSDLKNDFLCLHQLLQNLVGTLPTVSM